jgi:hypothetical protein
MKNSEIFLKKCSKHLFNEKFEIIDAISEGNMPSWHFREMLEIENSWKVMNSWKYI